MTIDMRTNDGANLPFEPTALLARWRSDTEEGWEIRVEPNEHYPSLRPVVSEILHGADTLRAMIDAGTMTHERLIEELDKHGELIESRGGEFNEEDSEDSDHCTLFLMAAVVVLTGDQVVPHGEDTCFAVAHHSKPHAGKDFAVEARRLH